MFKIESWIVVLVLILAFMLPFAALAQETTPEPTPVIVESPPPDPVTETPGDPPATTPETLLGQLYSVLKDFTYIAWAAAGVVVIVGLLKIVLSVAGVSLTGNAAILLTLVVQVLIWLAYSVANYFGQGETFQAWYLNVVDVFRSLLPLAGALFAGHVLYTKAQAAGVPVLGFKPAPKLKPATRPPAPIEPEGQDRLKP